MENMEIERRKDARIPGQVLDWTDAPRTSLTGAELQEAYTNAPGSDHLVAFIEVANKALQAAVEADELIPMAKVREIANGLYEQKRAARDLAIAHAVLTDCTFIGVHNIGADNLYAIIKRVKDEV